MKQKELNKLINKEFDILTKLAKFINKNFNFRFTTDEILSDLVICLHTLNNNLLINKKIKSIMEVVNELKSIVQNDLFKQLKKEKVVIDLDIFDIERTTLNEKLVYNEEIPMCIIGDNFEEQSTLNIDLHNALDKVLDQKERNILSLRYGFINDKTYTQIETGHQLDINKVKVARIERSSIRKLKKELKGVCY